MSASGTHPSMRTRTHPRSRASGVATPPVTVASEAPSGPSRSVTGLSGRNAPVPLSASAAAAADCGTAAGRAGAGGGAGRCRVEVVELVRGVAVVGVAVVGRAETAGAAGTIEMFGDGDGRIVVATAVGRPWSALVATHPVRRTRSHPACFATIV